MLQFDLSRPVQEIKKRNAKSVAMQVPEGLKTALPKIISQIEHKTGARAFAFVQPCFGGCDVLDAGAKQLGADLLLHFGHTQFVAKHAIDTVYVPLEYKADKKSMSLMAGKIASKLSKKGFKKIALSSTIQFRQHLALLEAELRGKRFKVFVGKGKNVEQGQVLGCNYSSVKSVEGKAEAVVFVGDGLFHPLGLGFAVRRPVFVLDPVQQEVKLLDSQRGLFLRKRIAMIEKVKQAKSVAIWVSTKKGQERMKLAVKLRELFERKGRNAFVFASSLIEPEYMLGIEVEAVVSTACPRIALDDSSLFKRPIVNPTEALIALGEKKIENYRFDELV